MSTVQQEVKRLGGNSLIYFASSVMVRGLGLLLMPLYSRALTPADYGVVATATTVRSLLGLVMCLAIHGAITPLHHQCRDDRERRQLYGTILGFLLVFPLVLVVVAELAGQAGFLELFRTLPFHPYLEITIWTAAATVFQEIPTTAYMAQERPWVVPAMSLFAALQQTATTLIFVVYLQQGAVGSLRAAFVSAILNALVALVLVWRMASAEFSWRVLKQALVVSIPLVPHLFSHWALSVLDRLVLEPRVPASELGLYSVGSQFSEVAGRMVVAAVLGAFAPMALRVLKDPQRAPELPRLGTYALLGMAVPLLGGALVAGDAIRLMTPANYHAARAVVPWLMLSCAMQGYYGVWSQSLWFTMNTKVIPVLTAIAAVVNLLLNLATVESFGIMAAAVNTALAYAVLALLYGRASQREHPVAWEYRKWALMLVAGVAWFVVGDLASGLPVAASLAAKTVVTMVAYPATLWKLGVLSDAELAELHRRGVAKWNSLTHTAGAGKP